MRGARPRSNQPAGRREVVAERRLEAFELRKQGNSYRLIGQALGISESTAHGDVIGRLREIEALEEGPREDVRRMELERLDALLAAHFPKALTGDAEATRSVLAVMKHRAALLGLEAPQQHEVRAQGVTVELLAEVMRRAEPQVVPLEHAAPLAIAAPTADDRDDPA